MARENDAMTQTDRAAADDTAETETVLLPASAVNTVIASLAEKDTLLYSGRYIRPLAEAARGHYDDEFVTVSAKAAKMGLAFSDETGGTRAFDAALRGCDEWGTAERSLNERLAFGVSGGRDCYSKRAASPYPGVSADSHAPPARE